MIILGILSAYANNVKKKNGYFIKDFVINVMKKKEEHIEVLIFVVEIEKKY